MSEHDYRSYMDRIEMSDAQHDKLMDTLRSGRAPVRRGPKLAHYAAAAACLALVLAAGFGLAQNRTALPPDSLDTPATAVPTAPETPPTPAPTLPDERYILRPEDPFDGQVHSSPAILGVEFDRNVRELAASIAYPDGWFEIQLTREDMVYLLGGEGATDAPWLLYWNNYDVTGLAIYNGQGELWQLQLSGTDRSNAHNTFSLDIAPGSLPPACYVDPDQTVTELHGIQVYGSQSGSYGWRDENGEFTTYPVYKIALLNGGAGLRFTVYNTDEDQAGLLATHAANVFSYTDAIHLDRLLNYGGDIPEWRSERLTLAQAEEEPDYGSYVQWFRAHIPGGFTFESAHRELGQNRDYLSLCWTGYYTDISITAYRIYDLPNGVMDVSRPERYDERLYTIPYGESVPEEIMFGGFQDPVFRLEDMTLDLVNSRVLPRSDSGDRSGDRGNFDVLYPDGTLVSFSFKGVRPEEVLALVCFTPESGVISVEAYCTVTGAGGCAAALSYEGGHTIRTLLENGTWSEGTSDCLSEYTLDFYDGLFVSYHTACGTFNDTANSRSLTLSEADRKTVNAILSALDLPARFAPESDPS